MHTFVGAMETKDPGVNPIVMISSSVIEFKGEIAFFALERRLMVAFFDMQPKMID